MKITVAIPMSDFTTIQNILPAIAESQMDQFMNGLKAFDKKKSKKGLKVRTTFSLINGFTLVFEGEAKAIILAVEDSMQADLKVLLEAHAASIYMMMGAVAASQEAYKNRK